MTFGEKLRQLRERAGLTQEQLAAASGVNLWTVRGYEQGRREPSWKGAIVLTRALGVTVEEFADCISGVDVNEAEAPKRGGTGARAQPKVPPGRRSPSAGGAK
jgi:transcriptional regulator with XRE-family HTH domain